MKVAFYDTEFGPEFGKPEPRLGIVQAPLLSNVRWADLCLFTSTMMRHAAFVTHPNKVLWLQETRSLNTYDPAFYDTFNLIISNDCTVLTKFPHKSRWLPMMGTWVRSREPLAKTKQVSMIASGKRRFEGHLMRYDVADRYERRLDGFGNLFERKIQDKDEGLWPYRYSVAIENERYSWYHTEKLYDCFATKTLPLYWGCNDLSHLASQGFDPTSVLPWSTLDDLNSLLDLPESHYESLLPAIEHNYRTLWERPYLENWLYPILEEHLNGTANSRSA